MTTIQQIQDQITINHLWTTHKNKIISYYHQNESLYGYLELENKTLEEMLQIYSSSKPKNIVNNNKYLNNYNIPNPEPNQIIKRLLQDYLRYIYHN